MIRNTKTRYLLLFILFFVIKSCCYADYVQNEPITLKQPNGMEINVFVSGDEYHSWIHDKDSYTIIQNPTTGYYCYAILDEDELVASPYIVGQTDPQNTSLKTHINISHSKILEKRENWLRTTPTKKPKSGSNTKTGTLNNIIVYIRFADQMEFAAEQGKYTSMFNAETGNSMKNYFNEISYGKMNIQSYFYPINNGTTIVSYQDAHSRNYYCAYSNYNTNGYANSSERRNREQELIANAINAVKSQIPSSLNLDYDNDGDVDNICFIVKGTYEPYNSLLWSHKWSLFTKSVQIGNKRVYDYNFQIEESLNRKGVGVLCHEMGHTFGAPDLYHDSSDSHPVDKWDLMARDLNPPQYIGAYVKHKYLGWIADMPVISKPGTYTLSPLSSASKNCYKIPLKSSSEYLVVEYRKKGGTFENQIYGSGLIIYRINEIHTGNHSATGHGGAQDEIYVFRPNGNLSSEGDLSQSYFSSTIGKTSFNETTNPSCFISDGSQSGLFIWNIKENTDGTLSFKFNYCGEDDEKIFSNTNNLPSYTKITNSIRTEGTVVVKSTDNVTFESTESIILGEGFEVKEGGTFKATVTECK